jgi:D-3-phosphoglycerate dehydrogenase
MKPRPKVVNVDCLYPEHYAYERQRIEAIGADFILRKAESESEIIAACADAEFVVLERVSRPFTARMIGTLRECREIIASGVGYEGIDVAAASQHGIVVSNAADYCTEEVADHAVAMLLASVRRLRAMNRTARSGAFVFPIAGLRRVSKLTLGLVGLGRIARGVAQRMSGFRVRMLAAVHHPPSTPPESGVEIVPLERLLRESDIVSIHLPLTAETRGLIGEGAFRLMKPTAIVVNTGRGAVMDQDALVRALQEKRIAGAALDVMAEEPLPVTSPLCAMEDLILTPHYGGVSEDSEMALQETISDSVEAMMKGYWPPFPVNPGVQPRFPLKPWTEFHRHAD